MGNSEGKARNKKKRNSERVQKGKNGQKMKRLTGPKFPGTLVHFNLFNTNDPLILTRLVVHLFEVC